MKDCKRCELWQVLFGMAAALLAVLVFTCKSFAMHDANSKRLEIPEQVEEFLFAANKNNEVRAHMLPMCPPALMGTCVWNVNFFLVFDREDDLDDLEIFIANSTWSKNEQTGGLGCLLRFKTSGGVILVDKKMCDSEKPVEENRGTVDSPNESSEFRRL